MAHSTGLPVWKEAPFIRLIIPLIAGILLQWYWSPPVCLLWIILCIGATCRQVYVLTTLHHQFRAQWWHGAWLHIILFAAGGLLCFYKNVQHQTICITNQYTAQNAVLITIEEPLTETAQGSKTIASAQAIITNHFIRKASGNILLYLEKDSLLSHLQYGSQLILQSRLQPVKNTGNPGGFDYQRYCAFQGIVYQAYVKKKEVALLPTKNENRFKKWLFASRQVITLILKKYISGRREAGLAEAMLIGYKDDLDKTLVQSYANTGVVHIIAISGLHLGLIYGLLAALCKPLSGKRYSRILQPVIIIGGLWLFSVLAGGSPSVLRSAVMFSFVVIGAYANRKTSIYNSLAASAFLLLCYNPFWLWDAGFQLSYAAVLSLAIFMKPIYNGIFIQNKWLNLLWKSIAVTLAAQILTVPISVYLFHQFPNLFLLANLLAVPLSSLVIMGEIVLCAISVFPALAHMVGLILQYLIYWLNTFIEHIGQLPFALLTGLSVNVLQVIYMYAGIYGFAWWLLRAKKAGMHIGLSALLLFAVYNTVVICIATHQQKLIVYNVPKHSAIDIFSGRQYLFISDSLLQSNEPMRNFYLQPCRLVHRIITCSHTRYLLVCNNLFRVGKTSFLVVEKKSGWNKGGEKMPVDVIILSHNPPVHIATLTSVFTCRTFVFDASNTYHNVTMWKKECEALGIFSFSVADRGAFVLNLY